MKRFVRSTATVLTVASLAACASVIKSGRPEPSPAQSAIPVPSVATTSTTATVEGSINISGMAWDGHGFSQTQTGADAAPVTLSDSRTGDEPGRSNKSDNNASTASASGSFRTGHQPEIGMYQLNLTALVFVRGGHWHHVQLFPPWNVHNDYEDTVATARASAKGTARITFAGAPEDELIVSVIGTPSSLAMTDMSGRPVTLTEISSGVYHASVKAGVYVLAASVDALAGAKGNSQNTSESKLTVSIQSLRDALRFGFHTGFAADGSQRWKVPVFIAASEIENVLKQELFKTDGKYFPCRGKDAQCPSEAEDLYLEWPEVDVKQGWAMIKLHLSGHGRFLFFRPGVTGDIWLVGRPVIDDGVLKLDPLKLWVDSPNAITKLVEGKARERIEGMIRDHAKYPVQKKLDEMKEKLGPVIANGACVLLDITDLKATNIMARAADPTSPAGVQATLDIGVRFGHPEECKELTERQRQLGSISLK